MTDVRILALRRKLHENAELSMHEQKTQQILKDFLQENTDLQIIEQPGFFCGLRKAEKARRGPIALRADIDALPALNGAAHYCGHDGHSAILANVAMLESGCQRDRDVYFLFQPGEETGEGARICQKFLEENGVEEIYGLHNIPGFPLNQILLKNGTFACGSVGLAITYKGAVSHAAYPEAGKNPAGALAALVLAIERLIERQRKDDILMATVIGIDAGSENYGISAGEGTLRLTVRAERQAQLTALLKEIRQLAKLLAEVMRWLLSGLSLLTSRSVTRSSCMLTPSRSLPIISVPTPFIVRFMPTTRYEPSVRMCKPYVIHWSITRRTLV